MSTIDFAVAPGEFVHEDRYTTNKVPRTKKWIVVHCSASGDNTFQALIDLMKRPGDRWVDPARPEKGKYGSAYNALATTDGNYRVLLGLRAGPFSAPPANTTALHICIPGRATQTRDEWLDEMSYGYIRGVAKFIVDMSAEFDIEARFVNAAEMLAGQTGYTSHLQVNEAWHKSDHYDPGPAFPWDVLEHEIALLMEDGMKFQPLSFNDGDIFEGLLAADGSVTWYEDGNTKTSLIAAGLCDSTVKHVDRLSAKALTYKGRSEPRYPDGYGGPRTTAAHFAGWELLV